MLAGAPAAVVDIAARGDQDGLAVALTAHASRVTSKACVPCRSHVIVIGSALWSQGCHEVGGMVTWRSHVNLERQRASCMC